MLLRREPPYVRFLNNSDDSLQMSLIRVQSTHPYPALAADAGRVGRAIRGRRADNQMVRGAEGGEDNVVFDRDRETSV